MHMPSSRRWFGSPSPIGVAAALAVAAPLVLAACDIGVGPDTVGTEGAAVTMTGNFSNSSGAAATVSKTGSIDTSNAFFQSLGTNGRACVTCHDAVDRVDDHAGQRAGEVQRHQRHRPDLPPQRRRQRAQPAGRHRRPAHDRVQHAAQPRRHPRRPADARRTPSSTWSPSTIPTGTRARRSSRCSAARCPARTSRSSRASCGTAARPSPARPCAQNLARQANDATLGHAQASVPLTAAQQSSIVAFETALFTAQTSDSVAGSLSASPVPGRPDVPVEPGVLHRHQRSAGRQPAEHPVHQRRVHALRQLDELRRHRHGTQKKASIARGQDIFNNQPDPHRGRRRAQRQAGHRDDQRHLHDLPRLAQRRQPLGVAGRWTSVSPARHRAGATAALHAAEQDHRRDHPDDRPGPRDDHRQVGRHRTSSRGRFCVASPAARRTSTTAAPRR